MEPYGADESVDIGAMLFTLVDPTRGHEVAYNRWYERDHFYGGCMIGPWLFAGRRWVATRRLKDARSPSDVPSDAAVALPIDAGSYLATYYIHKGHEPEHFAWTTKQVYELYENGRGFDERSHAHTSLYFFTGSEHRDPDGVPRHMALDHPYDGLITIHLDRPEGVRQETLQEWLTDEGRAVLFGADGESRESGPAGPDLTDADPTDTDPTHADLAHGYGGSHVDQVQHWRPIIPKGSEGDAPMELGTGPGTRQRSMQLLFTHGDPMVSLEQVGSYVDALESAGMGTVRLVAPFIPTVPGTDLYTDQLW